ncbi:MAG: D-glycerate dehydrogenase [Anaerolineae bacterium]|nr:D-glycerate dehydrogenase [Anaerolineae bacterium]
MKPKVYVTRNIPEKGLSLVREACDAEVWEEELPVPREILLEKVQNVEGLLCLLTERIDDKVLVASPRLRVVSNYAVGFNNIDVDICTTRGIFVGNTPDVLTDTTADFAFTLLMAAARRVVEGVDYIRAGKWKTWGPRTLLGQDIHGATLGIIGYGRIGKAMARRACGFDMRVMFYDEYVSGNDAETGATKVDFDTLLAESDFISLHVPLTEETYHFISTAELAKCKPTAVLINAARGPVVDPQALYVALHDGKLAAAGLDVTEPEPVTMDDPLLTLPNCIIVPHIASASVATRDRMAEIAARNLIAGLKGEPLLHCVNKIPFFPKSRDFIIE